MKDSCPVCGKNDYKVLDYGGYFYNGREMPLVKCGNCDLKYVIHGLSFDEIRKFYDIEEYFDSEYGGGASNNYVANKDAQEKKARFALNLIKKHKTSGKLLEIGSAGGYFMKVAQKEFGFDVFGVEKSKNMAGLGNKNGLNIFAGTIEDLPDKDANYDVVYAGDVLEHIPNPNDFVFEAKKRLKKGGILCLELPLSYNLTFSGLFIGFINFLRGNVGYKYFLPAQHRSHFIKKPPYHILMFGRDSIKYFLNKNGFEMEYLKIYEGMPKEKFGGAYSILKKISHFITFFLPQNYLGDRMIVIAKK